MERTIRNLMGAFIQHLAANRQPTARDAFQNLLDEPVVLRLFCGYIEGQSIREE